MTEGGYREFNEDTVATITFISHCRSLDIPLTDIKKLLKVRSNSVKSCREANEVIDDQLDNLRQRISKLKALEKQLAELRSVCNQELDSKDCQIIKILQAR